MYFARFPPSSGSPKTFAETNHPPPALSDRREGARPPERRRPDTRKRARGAGVRPRLLLEPPAPPPERRLGRPDKIVPFGDGRRRRDPVRQEIRDGGAGGLGRGGVADEPTDGVVDEFGAPLGLGVLG